MLGDRLGYSLPEWGELYPLAFLVLGLALLARYFAEGDRGVVFLGSVLTMIGLLFTLRNYDIIPYLYSEEYGPLIIAILGLGFIWQFLASPRATGLLIPGGLLLLIGLALFGEERGYWFKEDVLRFWPAVLVFVGVIMIFNAVVSSHEK